MTVKKRIVLIEPVGGHGGMDHYDYGLAIGLTNHGCSVDFFTCDLTSPIDHPEITQHNSFGSVWQTQFKPLKLFRFLFGYWKAFRFAKKEKALAVHLHFFDLGRLNQWVLFLGRIYSKDIFVTLHDISSLSGKSHKNFCKQLEKKIKGAIVHNQFSLNTLVSMAPGLAVKTRILPHGSYAKFVKPVPPLDAVIVSQKQPLELLFFGQIKPTKGLPILLKAMHLLEDEGVPVHLTIAGKPWQMDLKEMDILENQCNALSNVSYEFVYIPNETVSKFFEKSHIVILPYEQIYQSGVLLLSMSYGRPVLCSDLTAFKEIIKDQENGFLFEQKNPNALAEKIKFICQHPDLLKEVEAKANETLNSDFSWDTIGGKTLNFYLDS